MPLKVYSANVTAYETVLDATESRGAHNPSLLSESIALFLSIKSNILFAASMDFSLFVAPVVATVRPDKEKSRLNIDMRKSR